MRWMMISSNVSGRISVLINSGLILLERNRDITLTDKITALRLVNFCEELNITSIFWLRKVNLFPQPSDEGSKARCINQNHQ